MEKPDDIFILKLIKAGDEHAFKYLFEMFFASLCRFINMIIKNQDAAEEIALDIFTNIWEKRETLHIQLTFKAYLFQAARNRSLNYLRDNERIVYSDDYSVFEQSQNDTTIEFVELQRLIEEAIFSLPEKCREVFLKSREDNLSNKEIADQLNISVKTVEAQMSRALKSIRKYLGDAYYYLW